MGSLKKFYMRRLGLFKKSKGNKKYCVLDDDKNLHVLKVEVADDPTAINWNSLEYSSFRKNCQRNFCDLVCLIVLLICWIILFKLMTSKNGSKDKKRTFFIAMGIQFINVFVSIVVKVSASYGLYDTKGEQDFNMI